ncbi:hypothetical protein RB595_009647 [Gaeumannomyces hyphopodioides]
MPHRSTKSESDGSFGSETIQVLVGPEKKAFTVHKKLLCSTSEFFSESIAAIPAGLLSPPRGARRPPPVARRPAANRRSGFHDWTIAAAAAAATASAAGEGGHVRSASCNSLPAPAPARSSPSPPASPTRVAVLWFADQTPEMFELFVLWLYHRRAFAALVDEAVTSILAAEAESGDSRTAEARLRGLHWALVNLHLFAVAVGLPALQDLAMDAVQDLYLRLDWDVSPRFVRFLYEREADAALRLRKWAVAMAAWCLASSSSGKGCSAEGADADSTAAQFQVLLESYPEFCQDYSTHLSRMHSSRTNPVIKNPQLRIPTNALRNEERHFGFRMCSFHSHRASVGQGRCPHDRSGSNAADGDCDQWSPTPSLSSSSSSSFEFESDTDSPMSDSGFDNIVSPVSSQRGFDLPLPSELLPASKPCKPCQPPAAYGDFLSMGWKQPHSMGMRRVTE